MRLSTEGYRQTQAYLHLPKDSPLALVNHLNWRHKAILDVGQKSQTSLHFSSALACSKNEFEYLKERILLMIEEVRGVVKKSQPEEVYFLGCDFFKL